MTSTAEVGNLRVRLGIDSAEFSNGIRGVQEQLKGFGEGLKKFVEATAAVEIFNKAIEAIHGAAEIGKVSEAIGLTAEQLQAFNKMALATNVPVETMTKGLEEIANQSTNANSALSKLFTANGISTAGKSMNEIVLSFMNLLKNTKNPADQLAEAVGVLGFKVGRVLVDSLKEGSSGWHDAFEKMKADGSSLSEEQVKEAQKIERAYADVVDRLMTKWEQFVLLVAKPFMPDPNYVPKNLPGRNYGAQGQANPNYVQPGTAVSDGKGGLPDNINSDSGYSITKATVNPFSGVSVPKIEKIKKAIADTGEVADNSEKQFAAMWDAMSFGMDTALPQAQELTDAYMGLADAISTDLGDALAGLLSGTLSLKDAFTQLTQSISRDLEQLAAQLLRSSIMKLLEYLPGILMGGGGAGFSLGGMTFGGLYADGGTLGAGQWGIAGEAGPEIVHGPATITPMSKMGGSSVNVNVNNYANANVQTSRQSDGSLQIDIIEKHLASRVSRGGSILSQSLEKGYGLKRSGR